MRVKICGITDEAGFDAACAAGADDIGFVFFDRSPRYVTPAHAARLGARHAGGPRRVGLFVLAAAAPLGIIANVLDQMALDALQIYAPVDRSAEIAASFGLPVWRSVPVASRDDWPAALNGAAALLIEPKPRPDDARPGGLGRVLPADLLAGFRPDFFWFLAGGLTPDTVAAAIRATGAPGVDVSSGVESAPGRKDAAKIAAFVAQARGASGVSP